MNNQKAQNISTLNIYVKMKDYDQGILFCGEGIILCLKVLIDIPFHSFNYSDVKSDQDTFYQRTTLYYYNTLSRI